MIENFSMIIAVDCLSIVVLCLIYFDFGQKKLKQKTPDDRLFKYIISVNMALLFLDAANRFLNGADFPGAIGLNAVAIAVHYSLHPVICLLWAAYSEYKLNFTRRRFRRITFCLLCVPAAAVIAGSAVSIFRPLLFYVDEQNLYHRGPFYMVFFVTCILYLCYALLIALKASARNRRDAYFKDSLFLNIYPVLPLCWPSSNAGSHRSLLSGPAPLSPISSSTSTCKIFRLRQTLSLRSAIAGNLKFISRIS